MSEDELLALSEGRELSEETKLKIAEAFTKAVAAKAETIALDMVEAKTVSIKADLEQEYQNKIAEEIARLEKSTELYIKEELVASVDKYLSAAAQEYFKENKMAVESSIRVGLAESFLKGVSSLAKTFNVDLPKGADSVVEDLQNKLKDSEARLNLEVTRRVELERDLNEKRKTEIVNDLTNNMTETQREKVLTKLVGVDFIDDNQFKTAVQSVVESYAPNITEKVLEPKPDVKPVNENQQLTWEQRMIQQISR